MTEENKSQIHIPINIKQAYTFITRILTADRVPNLLGSPGLGKSDIIRKIAKDYNLLLLDFRLSQADPTDMLGFPYTNQETKRSAYMPPEIFPLETDEVPKGYSGWLLFFDEMNSAPPSVQAAAYKIILDKMVGQVSLHKRVKIICAGNLISDRAIVNKLSTAMQSRLIHLILEVDHKLWLEWAEEKEIDYRIKAFIRFRPDLLHNFDPKKHHDLTFPCPRTWEFSSDLIKSLDYVSMEYLPLLAGTIGEGTANEFLGFTTIYKKLPTIEDIINNPTMAKIPEEPSALYAVSSLVTKHFEAATAKNLMPYVERLPAEFQVIALTNRISKEKSLSKIPEIQEWIITHAEELI